MTKWIFEPGHTGIEVSSKHMMVARVRGHLKNVRGFVEFDPENPTKLYTEIEVDAANIWTGEEARDAHLRSADFLDVERYPKITFKGGELEPLGGDKFRLTGDLSLHGVTKPVTLDVTYLGQQETPYWEENADRGPVNRIGFTAETVINRFDFDVAWQDELAAGGVVVAPDVSINLDIEAIGESDLNRIAEEKRAA